MENCTGRLDFLFFVLYNTDKSKFEMLKRLSKQDECININIFLSYLLTFLYLPVVGYYRAVKETVEKTVEDVHENAPLVPSETNEDVVKAPAEAEEDKKQPESEKSETAATEKTEELPLENGKEEAEVVCAEEKPAEPEVVGE